MIFEYWPQILALTSILGIILKFILDSSSHRKLDRNRIFYENKLTLSIDFYKNYYEAYDELKNYHVSASLGQDMTIKKPDDILYPKISRLQASGAKLKFLSNDKEVAIIENVMNNIMLLYTDSIDTVFDPKQIKQIEYQNKKHALAQKIWEENNKLLTKFQASVRKTYKT